MARVLWDFLKVKTAVGQDIEDSAIVADTTVMRTKRDNTLSMEELERVINVINTEPAIKHAFREARNTAIRGVFLGNPLRSEDGCELLSLTFNRPRRVLVVTLRLNYMDRKVLDVDFHIKLKCWGSHHVLQYRDRSIHLVMGLKSLSFLTLTFKGIPSVKDLEGLLFESSNLSQGFGRIVIRIYLLKRGCN